MVEFKNEDQADLVMRLSALADAYGMLALLTQFPTDEVITGLADGGLSEDLEAILIEAGLAPEDSRLAELGSLAARAGADAEGEGFLSAIRREYTRLFNHPDAPALGLYEELFLHVRRRRLVDPSYKREHDKEPRTFVNNASFDAERIYKKANVLRTNVTNVPSDCMFVEMEFVQTLFIRLARAALEEDDVLQAQTLEHLREFKRLHLDKWMRPFYEDCAAESPMAFFGMVGCFGVIAYDLISEY